MKMVVVYLMLSIMSIACASSATSPVTTNQSWNKLDPRALNEKLQQAYASGADWVNKPYLLVFKLFYFEEIKRISYDFEADRTENPKNITIQIIREGFLDDSVRGDIHQIQLKKSNTGIWTIQSLKRAHSCWRTESSIYITEACP